MENFRNINPLQVDKTTIINLEKGKLPPQALDLEEAILGAMLIDRSGVDEVVEILFPEAFYKDAHKNIFEAIFNLFTKSSAIDLLTVSAELKRTSKLELSGGDYYLIQLTQKVSSSAHIEYWARIVLQKYIQRQTIKMSSEMIEESYTDEVDVFELLEKAYRNLGEVSDLINVSSMPNFKISVMEYFVKKKGSLVGIPSSIQSINRITNGYQDTDLIILAARPGMGKTAFALNEILECGLRGLPVAFFSLEMSSGQIIYRLLAIMSGIDSTKIAHRDLTPSEMEYVKRCADILAVLPIHIDDTPSISPIEFKIKLSKLKREHGIRMVWVDYLQLMKVKNKKVFSREQEISEISGSLKAAAKSFHIPITALSQLSRNVEQRGASKRPLLSDLRDSGSIEQDADIVKFIYRPEYYKIDEWDDDERAPTKNQAEIDIAKFRNGEPGVVRVGCELRYMRFMDLSHLYCDLQPKYLRREPDKDYVIESPFEPIPAKFNPNEGIKPGTIESAFPKPNDDEDSDVPF